VEILKMLLCHEMMLLCTRDSFLSFLESFCHISLCCARRLSARGHLSLGELGARVGVL